MSEQSDCLHVNISFTQDSKVEHDHLFQAIKSIPNIRVLTVIFQNTWTLEKKGTLIDQFLTPRPWWIVHKESMREDSGGNLRSGNRQLNYVRMLHIPVLDNPLEKLADIQFPSTCDGRHMLVK